MIILKSQRESFRFRQVFTIARGSRTEAQVITVQLSDQGVTGQAECVPYARYGETIDSVMAQLESAAASLPTSPSPADVQGLLPAGAARNALDCAMWDLLARQRRKPVWELAGLGQPAPLSVTYTLSLDSAQAMAREAGQYSDRPLLKVKLGGGDEDMARIRAVRAAAPDAGIIIDANEGWDLAQYQALAPSLVECGVTLVEQPLPAGQDGALAEIERVLPVCADESAHDRQDLVALIGKYDVINIKLDKTGGLTEALELREAAARAGLGIMVGCMMGSSLSMAPAALVAQRADIVDLDAPLLLAEDRPDPIEYRGAKMMPPPASLWGG